VASLAPVRVTDEERRVETRNRVIGMLNEVESLLTGWVLKEDRWAVAELTEPLYGLADKDGE
jgi:hypothetical protein